MPGIGQRRVALRVGSRLAPFLSLLSTLMLAGGAFAQTPGDVREGLRERPLPLPTAPPPDTRIERTPVAPIAEGGPRIPIESFEISGNTALSTEDLLGRIAQHAGKRLTLLEIYAVADELTEAYRRAGYTLATVTIPAQRISSGTVRFEVIEGRLERIAFTGNALYPDAFLAEHLDQLPPGEVIVGPTLEREMLLLNALPGLSSRVVVKPGKTYGTSELTIASEEQRFEGSARLNNYGRTSIGDARIEIDLAANNPLGLGDRFRLGVVQSEAASLQSLSLGYSFPFDTDGTRVRLRYTRFHYDVLVDELGPAFLGSTLKGDGTDYSVEVRHPVIRSRRETLRASFGLYRKESAQRGTGILPSNAVQLNAFFAGLEYTHFHTDRSVTALVARGSTNTKENPDGQRSNAHRGKLVFDASHLRRLPWLGLSFFGRVNAGWSLDPLMDIERYRLGGPGNVRAYPSAEISGDEGFLVQLQLNRRFDVAGVHTDWRVFYDAGRVLQKGEPVPDSDSLAGYGLGVSATLFDRYSLDLEVAVPTTDNRASDGLFDGRFWMQVEARY